MTFIPIKKTYNQTTSKLRNLWNIATRLIGEYENFDNRLTSLEKKVKDLSQKLSSTISGV